MDEHFDNQFFQRKEINIKLGGDREPSSRQSCVSVAATVPQLAKLSIIGNLDTGVGEVDGKECAAIFTSPVHNSNNSFYSDCSSKNKKHQDKLDINLVRLNPHIKSADSTHSKRSVNENLQSYMVIRQRSFHGFPRTRREMKTLPLTDPRDNANASDWLHRSKTDLYIEKRREKSCQQHKQRKSQKNDFDGMTFGYLVQHLPGSRVSSHVSVRPRSFGDVCTRSFPPQLSADRLPPLTLNRMKQMLQHDIDVIESHQCRLSTAHSESPSQKPLTGKLRKNTLNSACMPLNVWEPSLDCVFYSRQKELTPRNAVNTVRQQPSPLK
ncbi:uncharacterized protein LOC117105151 [Anneissia japonica]|uniref:uncharacterized protein LOC117105151 n=1 Tax=Anneissia japonica TaxID=1529436 RepID=UPI001425A45F|nr:uncharacterized protein LOC117105151 [Anneissia japonica]